MSTPGHILNYHAMSFMALSLFCTLIETTKRERSELGLFGQEVMIEFRKGLDQYWLITLFQ